MTEKDKKVDFQSLYPTALTEHQVYEKNLERRLRTPTPPRFTCIKTALALGSISFLLFLLIFNLEYFWSMGLPGIAASFLIMVGVSIGGRLALSYTSRVFEGFNKAVGPFIILYAVLIILLLTGIRFGWLADMSAPLTACVLGGIVTILLFVALYAILRKQD